MTWFRCGGGGSGIPAALKNRMNAVLNKKFGATVDYPPNGWPDDVNLLGELEEKTAAASSICTFADGADEVPLKNWLVTLPASLSGYSEVNGAKIASNNLLSFSGVDFTLKGVRFYSVNGVLYLDGSTVGEISSTDDAFKTNLSFYLPAGTYYLNRGTIALPTYIYDVENMTSGNAIRTNNGSFTLAEGKTLALGFYLYQKTFDDDKLDACVNVGSSAITYEDTKPKTSYTASLGRTIYGGTADIVNGTGDDKGVIEVFDTIKGNVIKSQFNSFNKLNGNILVLGTNVRITFAIESGDQSAYNRISNTYTADEQLCNLAPHSFSYASDTKHWYRNTVLYIFLPVSDVGTTAESVYNYLTGLITNGTPLKFYLPYNTPTEFTFDGQEINTRLGYNAFWSDSGDTEVTYRGQGTLTPVLPTLISKTITENGTYSAEDDGADGYDEVTVNVSGGGTIIVDDLIEYPYPNNDNKCIYSSELNTQYAYYAFNPDCGNPYYWTGIGATNQYIGWKFDTAQIVNYYEIWTRNVGNQYDYLQAPKEWKLQGSNDDGSTWTDLDAQDFTFTASGQKWASAVNNTTAYKWYRIYVITAQDTSNDTVIGYIDFKHAYISA